MLDGRLPDNEKNRLEAHLSTCDACRAESETLSSIRRSLLATTEVPLNAQPAERRIADIMTAVREKSAAAKPGRTRTALKPALGIATLVIVSLASFAVLQRQEPPPRGIFSDPGDFDFDNKLVELVNEHELLCAFESFNQTLVIFKERETNENLYRGLSSE